MRVLHVNEHLSSRGGVETYLLSLIPRLEECGHELAVAFASGSPELVSCAERVGSLAESGRRAEGRGLAEMRRVIRRVGPEVIHLHNVYNVGAIRACLEAAPTVVHAHDYRYVCPASTFYFRRTEEICQRTCGPGCFGTTLAKRCLTPRPGYAFAYYRRVRWIARNAGRFAGVIAPSGSAAERFVAAGFAEERTEVLPYFCPIEPAAVPREAPGAPTVLFMGRLSANKGYRYFVRALGKLPRDVRGVVVGNLTSEREAELRSLAAEAGCSGRLELRPWAGREEIRGILERTSVFVFPSLWGETLGIVGLEALACGVPVVASDVGGVREWLQHERNGLLVAPKDVEGMAAAIGRILEAPARAQEMGEAGIERIRERFSAGDHVRTLTELYSRAASSRSTRGMDEDARLAAAGLAAR